MNRGCPRCKSAVRRSLRSPNESGRARLGLLIGTALVLFAIIGTGLVSAFRPPDAPVQPIEYSHQVHAGELKLDCQFCHFAARRSSVAGVPPVASCMGCHVVPTTDSDSVELDKLAGYMERAEPIAWTQINDLPEYVRFSHASHIRAEVTCQSCHGEIQEMARVYQVNEFTMGFCVDCHAEEDEASIDCLTCHY